MKQKGKTIIYTDLDGSFLHEINYSFLEAIPALLAAQKRGIPVIFCSSKTRAEIEQIRKEAGVNDPFIVENGGAIFVPNGYFPFVIDGSASHNGYATIEMGKPYSELITFLRLCREEYPGLGIVGFSDLTVMEIAQECGMTLAEAERAKDRKYSEPFRISHPAAEEMQMFQQRIRQVGLRFSAGGRYYHLQGKFNKGISVRFLNEMFFRAFGRITSIGIGDSMNDLPMLTSVDFPIIVKRSSGIHDPELRAHFVGAMLTERIGPLGWTDAVMQVLSEMS